jgi:Fe-S cluster assembly protein SufB
MKGLNEKVIREISTFRNEPKWLFEFRITALKKLKTMKQPHWADVEYPELDLDTITYFQPPKQRSVESFEEINPEIKAIFEKLKIPLTEQKRLSGVAVDVVLDSSSIITTYKEQLSKLGILFCSFSEAVVNYPELVKQYLASIVPIDDNYFACLNSAVFSDGSFVFVPKGVTCPIDLSSYFRMETPGVGQFERTLIIAESGSSVRYLEGCTAPVITENQLHAAVVEIIAMDNATVKYSTIQNWYAGDEKGVGGVYNFVTKRGLCQGDNSSISWTQIETGASKTWKYPSCILKGNNSTGEFYSMAITKHFQQADTGTKMIHLGENTKSTIISKTICSEHSVNTYRGKVFMSKAAIGSKNYSSCDSLIIGSQAVTNTYPVIDVQNSSCTVEHEASTSKISQDQLNYLLSRGLTAEEATKMIVTGFSSEILQHLPMEFAMEARALLEISFEGSVG